MGNRLHWTIWTAVRATVIMQTNNNKFFVGVTVPTYVLWFGRAFILIIRARLYLLTLRTAHVAILERCNSTFHPLLTSHFRTPECFSVILALFILHETLEAGLIYTLYVYINGLDVLSK